jgi:intein/homing endonuclease
MKPEDKKLLEIIRDPKKYLEYFTKIKGKTPGLVPFILNDAQCDLFNAINENSRVIILKARQIGFCLSEHTKILLSNLAWVELKDVNIGDEVVSVDENIHEVSLQRKMKAAIVEKKFSFKSPGIKITLDNGVSLVGTKEHKLLSKKLESNMEYAWEKIEDMKIGDVIKGIPAVLGKVTLESGWEGKTLPQGWFSKIVSLEAVSSVNMVDLQTSEHTYIAEGFVSHNSTAAVGYLYHNTITTPGTNTALIGYNSDLTAELLDKVKTFWRTTPEAIRPKIQYSSKYEISFPAIDSKILVLPSSENVGRGYTLHNVLCVSGDTVVFGENGKPVRVSDITKGSKVINGNGGGSVVRNIIKKKSTERMLAIDVVGADGLLKTTENHEILTKDGWKRALDIRKNDFIAYPYFQMRNRFREIDFSLYPVKTGSFIKIGKVEINRDFGEFCGWFSAKGFVREGRISFSINRKEEEYLISLIKTVFGNELGKISVDRRSGSLSSVITITSQQISSFLIEKFGSGALNKTINDSCWYYGWEFGYGFLRGVFLGDGYFQESDDRKVVLRSISPALVYQVKKLLVSLKIGLASIQSSESTLYGAPGNKVYSLSLSGHGNYKFRRKLGFRLPVYNNGRFRWIQENDPGRNYGWRSWLRGRFHYWMKVRSVCETEREEFVYDIVLDKEPHSFLTHSGVVHNCTELAFWDKAPEKMLAIENAVPQNGKIVVESTPNGMGNQYHRMWMSDNDYCKKKYGWWWGYSQEQIEIIKKRINNPMRFSQEYGLEFLASGRPVFPSALIKILRSRVFHLGQKVKDDAGAESVVEKNEDEVIIYFKPKPGHNYIVGADVAEGVTGGDYSVFTIFDRTTGDEVAFWRGHMAPDRFGHLLDKIGRFFNEALMVVEINNHGISTVTAIRNKMYPRLYFRPVVKMDVMGTRFSDRLGWKTTKITRPLMIDDLREGLSDMSLKIHTEATIDEMLTFTFNDGGDMVAQSGFHDDCIFASAICLQGFKVMFGGALEQVDYEKELPSNFSY